jgi:hypothetical protein
MIILRVPEKGNHTCVECGKPAASKLTIGNHTSALCADCRRRLLNLVLLDDTNLGPCGWCSDEGPVFICEHHDLRITDKVKS